MSATYKQLLAVHRMELYAAKESLRSKSKQFEMILCVIHLGSTQSLMSTRIIRCCEFKKKT